MGIRALCAQGLSDPDKGLLGTAAGQIIDDKCDPHGTVRSARGLWILSGPLVVDVVPRAGLEPARDHSQGIFMPTTAFAATPLRRICGLDFTFAISCS